MYFTDGGGVVLDTSAVEGKVVVRWLDVMESKWQDAEEAGGGSLRLTAPSEGFWAVLVKVSE